MTGNGNSGRLGWREPILREFSPEAASVARLSIVADPDLLLAEQRLLAAIRERGFDVIPFDDQAAFRYAYESQYRDAWDRGDTTNLVVVLRTTEPQVENLPFDLVEKARIFSRLFKFSLGDIFPHLAPGVINDLDRTDLDVLYAAQEAHQPGVLGQNATKDFVLQHVFRIIPQMIRNDAELLVVLMRIHYRNVHVPASLTERCVELLLRAGHFSDWPLRQLFTDRAMFLRFLQERWPLYLLKESGAPIPNDGTTGLQVPGPAQLPFGHDDIRVYLDNFFTEGHLQPVDVVSSGVFAGKWQNIGVIGSEVTRTDERMARLGRLLDANVPDVDANYTDWLSFALRWGEYVSLREKTNDAAVIVQATDDGGLQKRVDDSFLAWLTRHYRALHNLSYLPKPAMLHHVPHFMAHGLTRTAKRALVVIDGLAVDQWVILRQAGLRNWGQKCLMTESATFAWIPTLTSVSRQAIFAGEPPLYFQTSIDTTDKEEQHWQRFWSDHGCRRAEVSYLKQRIDEVDPEFLDRVREQLDHPEHRIIGIVLLVVDRSLHGVMGGTGTLHAVMEHWAQEGMLRQLLDALLNQGYDVFLTSDHGNVEARGFGKPDVGCVSEVRGERVHVFPDEITRSQVINSFPDAVVWPALGLPQGYYPLLAGDRRGFMPKNHQRVTHGGASPEEVLVPFIHFGRQE